MRDAILGRVASLLDQMAWDDLTPSQQAAARAVLTQGLSPEDARASSAFSAGWDAAREHLDGGPSKHMAYSLWVEGEKREAERAR